MGETILVIGGSRSGKTRMAERLASEAPPVTYVATASVDPDDPEMVARVDRHRADRPADWSTREVPRKLDETITELSQNPGTIVVDCVTLWLTNLLLGLGGGPGLDEADVLASLERATAAARGGVARVVWVSNEVGCGVVPANELARRFADLQGLANQRLAAGCGEVRLCVAGLALRLK